MAISAEGEGGRIDAVLVEVGDVVKRGQMLARLDPSVLAPQVQRLAASVEEARAQAALSGAELRRADTMGATGALSQEEIGRRRAAAATDDARVKVATAQLAEAQARLDKAEIRAPANGTVLARSAEVGQMAAPGQLLFRIAGSGDVEMRGQVAERDLAQLSPNQPAKVYLTGLAKPFEGHVRLLGAVIDPQTRLGDIRVALAPSPALRPGAFARGEVVVSRAQRAVLPQTAVLSDSRGTYVFLVNGTNEVVRRPVRVANATPDGIVIAEGLTGNERIITTAGGFLRAGEKVQLASEPRK
jgi:RND family efflux transporter MFP subunit